MHNATSEAVVGPRDFPRVFNNIFLSLSFIGRVKKKRNDVTEIVLELEIADAIFRRERSDDRKCVCCSQANNKEDLGKTQDRSIKSDEIPAGVSLTPHGCRTGFNFI